MTAPDPFRAAADAVTQIAQTLDACAREVEARGGQRVARGMLDHDTEQACHALFVVMNIGRDRGLSAEMRGELHEMSDGCLGGYVRGPWALRIMQMGAEVTRSEAARRHLEEPAPPAGEMATVCGGGTDHG